MATLRKIVMKRIITSIIVAGIVIYTSVIFEQSFYLIGIPICAIIGGSTYLAKRNMKTGDLIMYREKRADHIDKAVAKNMNIKDGDTIILENHEHDLLFVRTPILKQFFVIPMNKKAFVLVD